MEIIKLSATPRVETGKSSSGRLRRTGQIPAIAYGRELAPVQVAVSPKSLTQILTSAHGDNSVVELAVEGGETFTVMVRDYDYHPISRQLIHADFIQVKLDQPVDVEVPFRCVGKAKGLVSGGTLQQIFRTIPVRSLPEKIPAFLEIDVSDLDVGESLKASALKLEEGVKVRLPEEQTIVVLAAPDKAAAEEEAKAAAAAPAAAGKAAPAPAKKDEKKK
ncbi:50S ribosomal protein L25/general stress protein Ctc [Chondromyces crocatus]|uniref:Large ribosomal subunit protein bL25 n=1 Tax=Chondromyces crocatus TaxID=52 RepID=A0A0K1EQA4_CHOCO|nr:50S ribosomal protein L25/general stress protein Ctc [Chondromyces crocatus]AKT42803.1 50S ribosomal protein L25 [Chondromyces crocatus]